MTGLTRDSHRASLLNCFFPGEEAATKSGAMNVIKISAGDALPGEGSSVVNRGSILGRGPDTGTWSIKDILNLKERFRLTSSSTCLV